MERPCSLYIGGCREIATFAGNTLCEKCYFLLKRAKKVNVNIETNDNPTNIMNFWLRPISLPPSIERYLNFLRDDFNPKLIELLRSYNNPTINELCDWYLQQVPPLSK